MTGYLEVILGPMFSGKTTHLVTLYKAFMKDNIETVAINYQYDTRYSESLLSTHDLVTIPCIWASNIGDAIDKIDMLKTTVILINEGQFFPDLYEKVYNLIEKYGKKVYVCGLDGDYKRNKFGSMLDLIPLSDNIVKLSARCGLCKNRAIFSHRISDEPEQIIIGSSNYLALCRGCYLKKPNKPIRVEKRL